MAFKEGDEVEITLRGKVTNGKLELQGELNFETVEEPPVEVGKSPTFKKLDQTPTKYNEVKDAVRGFEYVASWYRYSRWFLFSSVKIGDRRQLVIKRMEDGNVRIYDYNVVHCSVHNDTLYTIEENNGVYLRCRYNLSVSTNKTVAIQDRITIRQVGGDVACISDNEFQKEDVFTTTHHRTWFRNSVRIDTGLDHRKYQIYTLTMIEHKDNVDIGIAGIFRIDEYNGRSQIGPIYPVWCYFKDHKIHYPFGYQESFFPVPTVNPDVMICPGGTITRWGKELRFNLTHNFFAHTKWRPQSIQYSHMYSIEKERLLEAMEL